MKTSRLSRTPLALLLAIGATAGSCGQSGFTADATGGEGGGRVDGGPVADGSVPPGGGPAADGSVPPDGMPPLRVLFLGNSYTYVNDLPATVRAVGAATPGAAIETEMIAVGGVTLYDHWVRTGGRERIEMGGLDVVVLQGQSLEALDRTSFVASAALFTDSLNEAGARGVWFATWARSADAPLDPVFMTRLIDENYARAAELREGDVVARVGVAWRMALAELPEVPLYSEDGSHPAPAGTVLSACVIVHAMTGQPPRVPDPAPLGVPLATARALCDIPRRIRCLEDQADCDGACVEPQSDPNHCGGCGMACGAGDPCRAGVCGCAPGLTGCDRSCVDLLTDTRHCGACGTTCSLGEVCSSGDCVCPDANPQPITFEALAALRPACDTRGDAGSLHCNAAAHEHCAALDCFDSGFGPPSGHAPTVDAVMCVAGDVRATTYTELATFVAACDGVTERVGPSCTSAIHRYCVSTGAVSGFGPVTDGAGDDLTVTCVPSGTIVHTTYAALSTHASRCFPDPLACGVASWNFCTSMGYAGGFGPVEVSGDDRDVVCF